MHNKSKSFFIFFAFALTLKAQLQVEAVAAPNASAQFEDYIYNIGSTPRIVVVDRKTNKEIFNQLLDTKNGVATIFKDTVHTQAVKIHGLRRRDLREIVRKVYGDKEYKILLDGMARSGFVQVIDKAANPRFHFEGKFKLSSILNGNTYDKIIIRFAEMSSPLWGEVTLLSSNSELLSDIEWSTGCSVILGTKLPKK